MDVCRCFMRTSACTRYHSRVRYTLVLRLFRNNDDLDTSLSFNIYSFEKCWRAVINESGPRFSQCMFIWLSAIGIIDTCSQVSKVEWFLNIYVWSILSFASIHYVAKSLNKESTKGKVGMMGAIRFYTYALRFASGNEGNRKALMCT